MSKNVFDHLDDFWQSVKDVPGGWYNFGDYLARVTGFRDWQEQSGSVVYDGAAIYFEQQKAITEATAVWEAMSNYEYWPYIVDAIKNDFKDQPAYYLGSLGLGFGIGSVLGKIQGYAANGVKLEGNIMEATREAMEMLRKELGLSEEEFRALMTNDELREQVMNTLIPNVLKLHGLWDRSSLAGFDYNALLGLFVPRYTDPLVLDLNGDGKVSLVGMHESNTFFDLTNDGNDMSYNSGWIGKEDGILVYDENNNNKIDNINELFGNDKIDGFTDLKNRFDTNSDGVINNQDTNFDKLKVWQDLNQDGIATENELFTLDELGITEIRTENKTVNDNGEVTKVVQEGTFIRDGEEHYIADVVLEYNPAVTDYTGEVNLTLEMLTLPWLRGYGTVKDLHVMYTFDESLVDMVKKMSSDIKYTRENFELFLYKWTGLAALKEAAGMPVNPIIETSGGSSQTLYDNRVWILESLMGQDFFKTSIEENIGNKTSVAGGNGSTSNRYNTAYIDAQFKIVKDKFYNDFVLQAFVLNNPNSGAHYSVAEGGFIVDDKEAFKKTLENVTNSTNDRKYIIETLGLDYFEVYDKAIGMSITYVINEEKRGEIVNSGKYVVSNDNSGGYLMINNKNNQNITTSSSDDTITLNNSTFSNINSGLGDDTITLTSSADSIIDAGDGDNIVNLSSGSRSTVATGSGNDTINLSGYTQGINIQTGSGDDYVKVDNRAGLTGNEYIDLGDGDDTLEITGYRNYYAGNTNNITVEGGKGDDTLVDSSSAANTTYLFDKGDGKDTITDNGGNDTIKFGEGISKDDITFFMNNNDLVISYSSNDSITITNHTNISNQIENIYLNDGSLLTSNDINRIICK